MSVNIFNSSDQSLDKVATNLFGDDDYNNVKSRVTTLENEIKDKADASTTLEGYGITNAYTKIEVDSKESSILNDLSNLQTDIDGLFSVKSTATVEIGTYGNATFYLYNCGLKSVYFTSSSFPATETKIAGIIPDAYLPKGNVNLISSAYADDTPRIALLNTSGDFVVRKSVGGNGIKLFQPLYL